MAMQQIFDISRFYPLQKKTIDAHRIADQKEFDAKVLEVVGKVPNLAAYLNAKFSLTKGQFPHLIKF
jgi:large subunit ribosomal protein L6e